MLNLKQSPVLPNFIKALVIASFTLAANTALAAHHGEAEEKINQAEEKIRDLKDMTPSGLDKDSFKDAASKDVTDEAIESATPDIDVADQVEEMSNKAKESVIEDAKNKTKAITIPD